MNNSWYSLGDEATAIVPAEDAPIVEEPGEQWTFSAPMANWIIGNVPGIAGGIVGFLLANKLSKAHNVDAQQVLFSTTLVVAATFAGLFLIRDYDEFE